MSVISFISSWLKDIVVLFIVISIAELVMPKGNMKRYINLVIGLLIIFTIINPFAKLMKLDFSLDQEIFNYSKPNNLENDLGNKFYTQQEEQIASLYKEKFSKEVIDLVGEKTNYKVIDISVGIVESTEKYGDIDYLKLVIGEKDKETKTNRISIKKVSSIKIDNSSKESLNVNPNDQNDYDELKELIASKYSIKKDKISVKRKDEINE